MLTLRSYWHLVSSNRNFRRLWFAQLISLGGDWFNTIALLGLVLELTGSNTAAGFVLAANMLPSFLASPFAGQAADRFDRRRIMIVADLGRVFLALGMLFVRSPETVWIGIVFTAGISTFSAFFIPASGAALPNLVNPEELGVANSLLAASWGTMLAVGAALGGWVAGALGRDAAFVINAASFLFSALLIMTVKARFSLDRVQTLGAHPFRDMHEGIVYARSHPKIVALIASKGGYGFGVGTIVILPILATTVFNSGDQGIGVLFSARGIGVILGPLLAYGFVGQSDRRLLIALATSMAIYGAGYLALSAMPILAAAAFFAMVAHLGGGAQWILSSYGLQRFAPDYIRGRVLSLDFGVVSLSMGLSSIAAGKLADRFEPRAVMAGFALFEIAYALIWLTATRTLWKKDAERGALEPRT